MAMDRAEKLGLGAAVGGHGLLLGAFALGLMASAEVVPKQQSISVSLVGEIADVSTAPDAIQEESAPPAPAEAAPAEPPPAPAPVMQIEKPVEKQAAKPVPRPVKPNPAPPVAKVAVKKDPVKQPPAKAAAKPVKTAAASPKTNKTVAASGKGTTPAKPGGLSRSFEDSINNIGKAPGAGKAVGTPAAKSATEVRRSVGISIAGQIRSRVRACAPSGIDINKIETFVTLSLEPSGKLTSVRFDRQTGLNDSNQPQAGPLKDCILQAVRAASPYDGLDPEYHDVWKSHALRLRATG
jgi:outer membrane biosynthesis protein TonB